MEKVTGDNTPVAFGKTAPVLATLGWRPIPLAAATKRPTTIGWQQYNQEHWDADDLGRAIIHNYDAACGIALPSHNLALDLDVMDVDAAAEVAAAADKHLGKTPLIRIGQEPKRVLIYRSDGSIKSSKPHPIEVFSGSGQVAVFGWHQKAGRPYLWPEATPLDFAAKSEELPLVTDAHIHRFMDAVRPVLGSLQRSVGSRGAGIGKDAGELLRTYTQRGLSFRAAAKLVLRGAADGGRHYAIRAVVSAGYNQGMTADEIASCIYQRGVPADLLECVEADDYINRTLIGFEPTTINSTWSTT